MKTIFNGILFHIPYQSFLCIVHTLCNNKSKIMEFLYNGIIDSSCAQHTQNAFICSLFNGGVFFKELVFLNDRKKGRYFSFIFMERKTTSKLVIMLLHNTMERIINKHIADSSRFFYSCKMDGESSTIEAFWDFPLNDTIFVFTQITAIGFILIASVLLFYHLAFILIRNYLECNCSTLHKYNALINCWKTI